MRPRSLASERTSLRWPRAIHGGIASIALLAVALPATAYQTPTFTPMTTQAGLDDMFATGGTYGPGVAVVDIDNDGDLDLFVPNDMSGHKFYINDGTGHFVDIAAEAGLQFMAELPPLHERVYPYELDPTTMMPCFVDTDNDGDKDFFLTGYNTWSHFFENVSTVNGSGELEIRFVDRTEESGLKILGHSTTAAWGDYDLDGLPDVYVTDWGGKDRLFRNAGGNHFVDRSEIVRLYEGKLDPAPGWSAIWFDHNRDGLPDIYVGNDYGLPNYLYIAVGDGSFEDRAWDYFPELRENRGPAGYNATMGQALADWDHDGDYDLFVANSKANNLYVNNNGQFEDILQEKGYGGDPTLLQDLRNNDIGWYCDFPDVDQDGHEDLYLVNGYIKVCIYDDPESPDCGGQGHPEQPNLLWMNMGNGGFDGVTTQAGLWDQGWGKSGVFADFDLDGDLDLFVTNNYGEPAPGSHLFWRNDTIGTGNWLIVNLVGDENFRDALGAEVEVTANGTTWRRMRSASTGFLSYSSPELHFGLGDVETIEEIRVRWPNGTFDVVEGLQSNRRVTIVQGEGLSVPALVAPELRGQESAGAVRLSWDASALPTGVDRFLLQRTAEGGIGGTLAVIATEPGRTQYEYVDRAVEPGRRYDYRLTVESGDLRVQGDSFQLLVGAMARRVEVSPAAPNPFNPRTTLRWRVAPGSTGVRLRLFDLRGRMVREFDASGEAGWNSVVWDGTDAQGRAVASGNYRFVVEADGQVESTSLTLVR